MQAVEPALDAIPWNNPVIHEGRRNQLIMVTSPNNQGEAREVTAFLVKTQQPIVCAYYRIRRRQSITLSNERGYVIFCYVLNCVENAFGLVFEDLTMTTREPPTVAIKVLNKNRLLEHSRNHPDAPNNQNPFTDIMAMQALGNDTNVIRCLEALQDEQFIYIVTPYIESELHSIIPWNISVEEHTEFPENVMRHYFIKLLKSLRYIQQHNICHRDIKGENILVDRHGTSTIMIDMEMSLQIPRNETTGEYHLVRSTGICGTLPFLSPEGITGQDFDGFALDIWSLGVVLFNMLTGERLYDIPRNQDNGYRHFIVEEGLINDELNNRWLTNDQLQPLVESNPQEFQWINELLRKMQKVQHISRNARNLLHNMLKIDFRERYTLEQIFAHPWVNGGDDNDNEMMFL